ncbi:acyltransferase-like protein, partial [Trifolium medium]|nr:acyltransferase-like protein [Trifolium medium]
MVAAGASFFPTIFSPIFRGEPPYQALKLKSGAPHFAMSINRVSEKQKERRSGWKEYLKQSKEMIKADGGAPRWFSPLECSS